MINYFVRTRIGLGIDECTTVAEQEYPGTAEEVLNAYLSDKTHIPDYRSDVAIWTLGQIWSKKALPLIKALYRNDPQGKTCKYHHDKVLCL